MKTLIIEDNPLERSLFEEQIRSFGYDVTACPNAETALTTYQQVFYPLIVVDLGLPGIDGLECCRRIRALPDGDRGMILVITGQDELKYSRLRWRPERMIISSNLLAWKLGRPVL